MKFSRESSLGEHRAFTYGTGDRIAAMADDTGTTTYLEVEVQRLDRAFGKAREGCFFARTFEQPG